MIFIFFFFHSHPHPHPLAWFCLFLLLLLLSSHRAPRFIIGCMWCVVCGMYACSDVYIYLYIYIYTIFNALLFSFLPFFLPSLVDLRVLYGYRGDIYI